MKYTLTTPCSECPFLKKMAHGFTIERLEAFASGSFPCHKTAECDEESLEYKARPESLHCAGALIYLEKAERPNQMMRIAGRLGFYDPGKLNMYAPVREAPDA